MKSIYYDFTKLDEFFNCAPSDPIEILSEEEMVKQGMIEPVEGEKFSGPSHPRYIDGLWLNNPKEYMRKYYQENKERMNENHKRWSQENKEKIKEYKKQYCLENKDRKRDYDKQYYEKNKERIKEQRKEYYLEKKNT